jgi:hypothetical protein
MALLDDIRSHLAVANEDQRKRRGAVLLREAAAEIERLREAIRRLAGQDATLSVCDGNVTVTIDGSLTDAEREAIADALEANDSEARLFACEVSKRYAATLRGLLERTR